ncbi:MAG: DUF4416 family protein [Candidatus Mcinerneyibacterium aminivorans]|uniref:DUF4416 family protein n=1 Tax=Candidatus Mcinerneyibacterium aminivorans TaxID=2703815 RepID=A0A5D0MLR4_9BACT|nr:MAG: DUF4416 family protein [Candidatus Mcinerneyibacterium aminivorans]
MGKVDKNIEKVMLFVGILYTEKDNLNKAIKLLKEDFGKTVQFKHNIDFDVTDYYNDEMGSNIKKAFIVFNNLIEREKLADIKLKTNKLEKYFRDEENNRKINLDPGYIALPKLVLATTKDRSHRIYIGKGIFAEVTLYFYDNSFRIYNWTYPDFKKEEYIEFFNQVREKYKRKLNNNDSFGESMDT